MMSFNNYSLTPLPLSEGEGSDYLQVMNVVGRCKECIIKEVI